MTAVRLGVYFYQVSQGGESIPSIFKALASITVWVLFIFGLGCLAAAFGRIAAGDDKVTVALMTAYFGFAVASLFLSVVVMKMRKALD